MLYNKKSKVSTMSLGYTAFTLVEILITITVIGVIAVIIVSNINQQIQNQILKSQFKKTYRTLYNATLAVKANNEGVYPACRYDSSGNWGPDSDASDCATFYTEFKKTLNVVKSCNNSSYANGCVPNYTDNSINGAGSGWYDQNHLLNINSSFVLEDGTIIVPYGTSPLFMVDINGAKPPNRWGVDMFSYIWAGNSTSLKLLPDNFYTPGVGGVYTTVMLKKSFE